MSVNQKVSLKQGGFVVDATAFARKLQHVQPPINPTFAGIAPRVKSGAKKGHCNFAQNAKPLRSYQLITATGSVTFS